MIMDRLKQIRHVVLDMDGTIYLGERLFSCTEPFLNLIGALGIGHSFITNNCSRSVDQYVTKLRAMGVAADAESIFTSSHATIEFLRSQHPEIERVFVLGTPSLREEMRGAGFTIASVESSSEPDAVVVGFDTALVYENLCQAAYWIGCGKLFVATHPDRVCPTDRKTVLPDCGSICACLEHATQRAPSAVLGKPSPHMIQGVTRRHDLHTSQVAVVGDRLYTDIEMARKSGALGVLVLTGETDRKTAEAAQPGPDLTVADLAELGQLIKQATEHN